MKIMHLFRFRLRTIFVVLLLVAGIVWWFAAGIELYRDYQDYLAHQRTNQYEMEQARIAAGGEVDGLVTILGESRFKHWAEITQIEVLSDRRVISSAKDGSVRIWNRDGSISKVFEADSMAVGTGGHFYAIGRNGGLDIYDAINDRLVHTMEIELDYSQCHFSIDGSGTLVAFGSEADSGVYDVGTSQVVMSVPNTTFQKHTYIASQFPRVRISPDGSCFAAEHLSQIYILQVKTKRETIVPEADLGPYVICDFQFDKTGNLLMITNLDGLVGSFDLAKEQLQIDYLEREHYIDDITVTDAGDDFVGISKDQLVFVDIENAVIASELIAGSVAREPLSFPKPSRDHDARTKKPAGMDREMLLHSDKNYKIRQLNTRTLLVENSLTDWNIRCIEFLPDGKFLLAGCSDGIVRFFNVKGWAEENSIDTGESTIDALAISRDGKFVATSSNDSKDFLIFDTQNQSLVSTINANLNSKQPFTFTPTNDLVWLSVPFTEIHIFDFFNARQKWVDRLSNPDAAAKRLGIPKPKHHKGKSAYVTTDGRWLLTSNEYHSVAVWDIVNNCWHGYIGENGDVPFAGQPFEHRFFVSPNEELIATIGLDGSVKIHWLRDLASLNVKTVSRPKPMVLQDDFGADARVAFSHDGKMIFTTGRLGIIKLWDRKDGSLLKTIKVGPTGSRIHQIRVSLDDRYFATTNGNGTCYVFRVPDYQKLVAPK